MRPGELRAAEWSEFQLEGDQPEWRIPAARMKMREQHLVPLARQSVALVRELEAQAGGGRYLFPSCEPLRDRSVRTRWEPHCDESVFQGKMTAHGFRAMASTLLNELGFHPDVIELQLAHAERSDVRAAYNRARRLAERRKMMQAWADYLDGLKSGGKIVAFRSRHWN